MLILETKALRKTFGRNNGVKDANLELHSGRIYGLLGPNGSGKSTLMKMIAQLYKPAKGQIYLDGAPLNSQSKAKIAFMSTESFIYQSMTVKKAGKFYESFFDDFSYSLFLKIIREMQLEESMKINTLSSGMIAKLKISLTMSRDARVFLIDEPLNGIDVIAKDEIMKAIIERMNDNNVILLSSHLIETMESILDEVIFIKDGEIVLIGNSEEIREERGQSIVDIYKEVYAYDGIISV